MISTSSEISSMSKDRIMTLYHSQKLLDGQDRAVKWFTTLAASLE